MCGDKSARMIIKTGSGVPTIPVSADHRNGDWLVTDIYEGESYMDTDTGIVYTRNGSSIESVGGGGGGIQPKIWKARVSQTGTSAPVLTELINTLGVTITPAYDSTGVYTLSGFGFSDLTNVAVEHSFGLEYYEYHSLTFFISLDVVQIETTSSNVGVNGLLNFIPPSNTITVTKYD